MTTFFDFEADFVDSLRCIPMVVRMKLDTCGVKLKLAEWNHFTQSECERLVQLPCERAADVSAYRDYVSNLILQHTGHEASLLSVDADPAWLNDREIPTTVLAKITEERLEITVAQWAKLTPLQRFALIKLTRSSHENNNFLPALREFRLIE
jgi:hypothetical protein